MLTCEPDVFAAGLFTPPGMFWVGCRPRAPVGHSYTEPGIDGRRLPGREPGITTSIADTITPPDGHRVRRGEVPGHQLVFWPAHTDRAGLPGVRGARDSEHPPNRRKTTP